MASSPSPTLGETVMSCTRKALQQWEVIMSLDNGVAASWNQVATDELCRFQLWANNLGALHAASDPKSADHRLRGVPDVRRRILQLVDELLECFDDIEDIMSGKRLGETEELEGLDDPGIPELRSEISELWRMVAKVTTNLMKVSILVRKSVNRNRFEYAVQTAAKATKSPVPTIYDTNHALDRYPKLRLQPWLAERLGEANAQRRQYLMYARNHEQRISSIDTEVLESKSVLSRPTEASTRATTAMPDNIDTTTLAALDQYEGEDAMSTMSATTFDGVSVSVGGRGVDEILPLSSICKNGNPGFCPYCRGPVFFARAKAWRQVATMSLHEFKHC